MTKVKLGKLKKKNILLQNLFIKKYLFSGLNLKDTGYDEWGANQPDGVGKDHCGSILWNGRLDDVSCDLKAMFFCEKEDITPS